MSIENIISARRAINSAPEEPFTRRQIPLGEHLDKCSMIILSFRMFPFFKMLTECISARLAGKNSINYFKPKLNT